VEDGIGVDKNNSIVIKVPPKPVHLAVLRTAVGGVAARDSFTLDQINDLRLAVEEAATQLLRHVSLGMAEDSPVEMTIRPTSSGLEIRLTAEVDAPEKVIDESSFSWVILRALADEVRIESQQSTTTVVLIAHRLLTAQDRV
jgi:serine/threonine-protein kinase RsbW